MSSIAYTPSSRFRHAARTVGAVTEHGISLLLPLCVLSFLVTGPHSPWESLLWTLPVWLFIGADFVSPADRRPAPIALPPWPFDTLLYTLAFLQLVNIGLMVILVAKLQWTDASTILASVTELLAVRILVGTNSCCSGIAVAHELIHRRRAGPRFLGRCLLATVCYAHFAVEHLRRHHRHVGTAEDPATARLGESYSAYWRRTKKEQFVSAWRLESARLRLEPAFALSTKLWRHEVFLGLVAEAALIIGMLAYGGPAAAGIFLLQSLAAVRLLEAVNYFQHWGLEKSPGTETPFDAWVTDSWFSMHVFVGLARHSDHHRHGGKPYHRLDFCGRGPRLPFGYLGMALLAKSFNRRYQRIARTELRRYRRKMTHSGNAATPLSHQGVESQ